MSLTTQWSAIERMKGHAASDAWLWFVDRYRPFVASVLRRLIWSAERAHCAHEEFWGYLFQSGAIDRLQERTCFRAFLTGTLRNYAHDWMRRNPSSSGASLDGLDAAREPLREDEEVGLWGRQLLHLALQRMDAEQPRQARTLRAFYGVPDQVEAAPAVPRRATELAEELGCPPNALHQLLFRARRRLHECLVDEVRQTVSSNSDLESEMDVLLGALGRAAPGILVTRVATQGGKSHGHL